MKTEFIDLTLENLAQEQLCCIVRTKKPHPGVEAKRRWLCPLMEAAHGLRKAPKGRP